VYHQDPNFYYLTGYKEPNAALVMFSETQADAAGNQFDEIIYGQERDARAEQWTGKRLGVEGVKEKLGFDMVFNGSEFENFPLD
ncbi:aminopeptidase P N-terminal domain-containing protein, partial [Winogradskyella poriferorum]|uniref:aminopeptidase P N-terminal domain-containing protein n=1 Tax=Winogradskyella poriferorum TaxID=307627 RepID=UPI003D64A0CB